MPTSLASFPRPSSGWSTIAREQVIALCDTITAMRPEAEVGALFLQLPEGVSVRRCGRNAWGVFRGLESAGGATTPEVALRIAIGGNHGE